MELVTIGEAAQVLALNTSALRYYEDRGLVTPSVAAASACTAVNICAGWRSSS